MFFSSGRVPVIAIVAVLAILADAAYAQQDIPLTLAEAEDLAVDGEPGTAALLARADALEERAVAAGQLPDPRLRVGLNNFPIDHGGFSSEAMTSALVGVQQAFPPGKTRSIRTQEFAAQADAKHAEAETRNRDVVYAVRRAWLEAYYWSRARQLVASSRPFFNDLADITRSLYAVGRRDQQDVLRAELELSRLDDRLIDIDTQRAATRSALAGWIGASAERPIAEKMPEWSEIPDAGTLRELLQMHPALVGADAMIAASAATVDLAEQAYKPGWAIDFGYGYRQGELPSGDPRSDLVSLSVSVDLPFFGRRNRQDRSLAAALGDRRAAVYEKERLQRELSSRLSAEIDRWQDLTRRLELFDTRILQQSSDQAEAALLAYQSDSSDFADVMRAYIDNLDSQLDYVRLRVERARSYAAVASLGGLPR